MVERIKVERPHREGKRPGTFDKRPEGSGRKKGQQNKVSGILKEAILAAAGNLGDISNRGRDGLTGYLMWVARRYPEEYVKLLAKVLPMQITGPGGGPLQHEHNHRLSAEEAREKLLERGIPIDGVFDRGAVLLPPPTKAKAINGNGASNGHAA